MAYCNQLFSEQMETRAVRTELLTAGNPLHRPKQDFYGFESTTAELSLTLFASKPVENSYRTSSHVAQRAQFLSRFVRNPYSWNTVGEFGRRGGSGLHKLSRSPKLPLVFAPGYVNTARVIYFLNRRIKFTICWLRSKTPSVSTPTFTYFHSVSFVWVPQSHRSFLRFICGNTRRSHCGLPTFSYSDQGELR